MVQLQIHLLFHQEKIVKRKNLQGWILIVPSGMRKNFLRNRDTIFQEINAAEALSIITMNIMFKTSSMIPVKDTISQENNVIEAMSI